MMMKYIKRRFSSSDLQNEYTDTIMTRSTSEKNNTACQSAPVLKSSSDISASNSSIRNVSFANHFLNIINQAIQNQQMPNEKSKLLFIIDDQYTDWKKYFKNRKIFADYDIHVEQAEFTEINLSAYSDGGILIRINGIHAVRTFRPDFVLVRQYVRDVNVDWRNIILGMQYGAVPSVNSMKALYHFRDKPWIFAELLSIQRRLGTEQFPLISQVYYPNHHKNKRIIMKPRFPFVIKVGQAHQGLGKIKVDNPENSEDLSNTVAVTNCYFTMEPYINGRCDVYIQKIGENYKVFTRKSFTDNWKTNNGSAILEQIEMTDRYRLWIDEVSQILGGLDICAIQLVRTKDGKEFIIQINDCTMQLLGETQEEDCRCIAELIIHKMQIYCRPDNQPTVLTRIPSIDKLPIDCQEVSHLPRKKCHNRNIRRSLNSINIEDTLANLRKTFAEIFGDMLF